MGEVGVIFGSVVRYLGFCQHQCTPKWVIIIGEDITSSVFGIVA
jgi:hypothetical protein